jgi:hypothetical protein
LFGCGGAGGNLRVLDTGNNRKTLEMTSVVRVDSVFCGGVFALLCFDSQLAIGQH